MLDALSQEKLIELQEKPQWEEGDDKDKVKADWKRRESVSTQGYERSSKKNADAGQTAREEAIPHYLQFPDQLGSDSHACLITVWPELTACYEAAKSNCYQMSIDAMGMLLREINEAVKREEDAAAVAARAKGETAETEAEAATKRAGRGALMAMRVCGQTLK